MTFKEKVEALHKLCPYTVSSAYRNRALNREVGGSWDSMHLLALAMDAVLDDRTNDLKLFIRMAVRLGLFVYDEGDHIHIHEMFPNGMIWNG